MGGIAWKVAEGVVLDMAGFFGTSSDAPAWEITLGVTANLSTLFGD